MFGWLKPADVSADVRKAEAALPGRSEPIPTASHHAVNGRALQPPFPAGSAEIVVGSDAPGR